MTDPRLTQALESIGEVLARVKPTAVTSVCAAIRQARSIGIYGCGREGYQMRGFAMRLFHLGLSVGYLGETTMPRLGAGDLLVVSAGPGELATVDAHMNTARNAGARVVLITAEPATASASNADLILHVPARTMAQDEEEDGLSILPMGSIYEGVLFLVLEWVVADLKSAMGETARSMRERHTNME